MGNTEITNNEASITLQLDKKAKMSGEAESGSEDEETEPEFRSCTNYRYFGDSDQESVSVSNKDNR